MNTVGAQVAQDSELMAINEARRTATAGRILSLTASLPEIMQWHDSDDPLREMYNGFCSAFGYMTAYYDRLDTGQRYLYDHIEATAGRTPVAFGYGATALIDSADTSTLFAEGAITQEHANRILTGIEMMHTSCFLLARNAPHFWDEAGNRYVDANMAAEKIYSMGTAIGMLTDTMLQVVPLDADSTWYARQLKLRSYQASIALNPPLDFESIETTGQISHFAAETDHETAYERQKAALLELFDELQALYLDDPRYLAGLSKGERKGLLHEALWPVDAFMLKQLHPEMYGHLVVKCSNVNRDAPKIGYPRLKRGYDFIIQNPHTGVSSLIQAKSGSEEQAAHTQKSGGYHPAIQVIHEGNFLDVDKRRLGKKLQVYRRWAENGFTAETAQGIEKLILQSVRTSFKIANTATELPVPMPNTRQLAIATGISRTNRKKYGLQ